MRKTAEALSSERIHDLVTFGVQRAAPADLNGRALSAVVAAVEQAEHLRMSGAAGFGDVQPFSVWSDAQIRPGNTMLRHALGQVVANSDTLYTKNGNGLAVLVGEGEEQPLADFIPPDMLKALEKAFDSGRLATPATMGSEDAGHSVAKRTGGRRRKPSTVKRNPRRGFC